MVQGLFSLKSFLDSYYDVKSSVSDGYLKSQVNLNTRNVLLFLSL